MNFFSFLNLIARVISRSHHYAQFGNALQKHFFDKYNIFDNGYFKRFHWSIFQFQCPKSKFYNCVEWTRFAPIFPYSHKSISTKRAHIHLIWKIIEYWSFFTKRLGWSGIYFCSYVSSKLLMTCSWKNYIFPVKSIEIFAWILSTKLNY